MAEYDFDLLSCPRGTVTAPAGCGKTQLIAHALKRHTDTKPVLVLTHTNAGVAALRGRLTREGVSTKSYRLMTIDGWALRLISTFPTRSGHDRQILNLKNPKTDYPAIRTAAWKLLSSGHLSDALRATYSRLWVDEYQDCSLPQHCIVGYAAKVLPTCVLGDPLQAIFDFAEPTVNWETQVLKAFKPVAELNIPWRWKNAECPELGQWLLDTRPHLQAGTGIDLRGAPSEVTWIKLADATATQQRLAAATTKATNKDGSVLLIGAGYPSGHQDIASKTPGALTVEATDLKDLTLFGSQFKPGGHNDLEQLVHFAGGLMTNIGAAALLQRIKSLCNRTARKGASPSEAIALEYCAAPSFFGARALLSSLKNVPSVRVYRPEILRGCLDALSLASEGNMTFYEATVATREKNRLTGRSLPRRAVGSTLLLKGLEADVAVLLHADDLTPKNLYVALTRGARQIVVCSKSPVLGATR